MAIKCTELTYSAVNALTFRISGGTKCLIPHKINNVITSLEGPDDLNIKLGISLKINKFRYKINIIEQVIKNKIIYYNLSTAKRNKSSTFILPMLGGERRLFFWNRLFMNAFVGIEDKRDCIVLLYKFSADPLFLKFEKAIKTFKSFSEKVDIDPYHVLFIFDIPKNHVKNYNKLKKGKYSEMTEEYKLHLLDFHNLGISGQIGQVLWKSSKRRRAMEKILESPINTESELLTPIDFDKEIYNLETYEIKQKIL